METFDTIVIGGGAAAMSAALYARRYNLSTLVLTGEFGGETSLAGKIENYPGVPSIDGFDLMQAMRGQAESAGARFVSAEAELVSNRYHCFRVRAGKETFDAKTLVVATGTEHRKLGLAGEEDLRGKGIHYCATCDGPLFKGKRVGVVGGGDSAVKWGSQLSDMGAAEVTMFVREKDLSRAEPVNRARLAKHGNVTVLFGTSIVKLIGTGKLASVRYATGRGAEKEIPLDGLFVAIGSVPRGEIPGQLGVKLDARGQVDVDPRTMATSVDGVFAAGDVTNASGGFKQIVTGAAQGAIAATSAYLDSQQHSGVCRYHAVPVSGLLDLPENCHAVVTAKTHFKRKTKSSEAALPAKKRVRAHKGRQAGR